jgi:hypothetical protein
MLCLGSVVSGQDLGKIKDAKPIEISGSFTTRQSYQHSTGSFTQRDPFFWMFNANLNICLWGVLDIPLSATYSKKDKNFNYPQYKEFGISPSYKSITAHIGYRALNLSTYSLAGIIFLGGGIEYQPSEGVIDFTALYGRFHKAATFRDIEKYQELPESYAEQPLYERWGYGGKIGFTKKQNHVDLIMFRAYDNPESVNEMQKENIQAYPEENFIVGIITKNPITKQLTASIEYTLSAHTANAFQDEVSLNSYTYANHLGALYTPRISSSVKSALIGDINFKKKQHKLGLTYKRVEPDYQSLGTDYLLTDIVQTTIYAASMLKKVLRLSGSFGTQHNNLDNSLASTMSRVIGSANIGVQVSPKLNFQFNLSNFSSNTLPSRIDVLDSIKYVQITNNYSFSSNYSTKTEQVNNRISGTLNYQTAETDQSGNTESSSFTKAANAVISYNYGLIKNHMNMVTSVNISNFKTDDNATLSYGPTVALSKDIMERKLKLGIQLTYIRSFSGSAFQSRLYTTGCNTTYKINKRNSIRLGLRYLDRKPVSFSKTKQFQCNISYRYLL